ncbi:MAG: hypothetical protein Q8L48_41680 [Archangium sp.]|nr:hypothetical protein [Archangium sp.]
MKPYWLLAVLCSCGACPRSDKIDLPLGRVVIDDAGRDLDAGWDAGTLDSGVLCSQPRTPHIDFRPSGIPTNWSAPQSRGHRQGAFYGGSPQRQIAYREFYAEGSAITSKDSIINLDTIVVTDNDGSICGGLLGTSGIVQLAIQFPDAGVFAPELNGHCAGYQNGWWLTRADRRLKRGRHGSAPDWVSDRDVDPLDIGADGTVLALHWPGGESPKNYLYPDEQLLPPLYDGGYTNAQQLASRASVTGVAITEEGSKVPVRWVNGQIVRLPTPFVPEGSFMYALGPDGRACGQLRAGSYWPVVAWSAQNEYADLTDLASDGGIQIVNCLSVLADDWFTVAYKDQLDTPLVGFIRVQWDCPD